MDSLVSEPVTRRVAVEHWHELLFQHEFPQSELPFLADVLLLVSGGSYVLDVEAVAVQPWRMDSSVRRA